METIQRRTLRVLFATQVLGGVGTAIGLSVGALLAAEMVGVAVSGLAQSAAVVGAALLAVPATRIVRDHGRRPSLAAVYGVAALGGAIVFAAVLEGSVPLLFAGLFLFGGGSAAGYQARYAAVDLAPPDARGRHLSLIVWATTIGAVAGPNLAPLSGAALARWDVPPLAAPFLFSTLLFGLAAAVLLVLLRPDPLVVARASGAAATGPRPDARALGLRAALRAVADLPLARLGIASAAVGHVVMVGVMAMTPVHIRAAGHDAPTTLRIVGIVLSVHIAGMFAFAPVTGWLTDRYGRRPVILGAIGVLLAACAVAGTAGHASAQLAAGLTLLGLGWSGTMVAGSTLLSETVPAELRPSAQGLADVVMGLAGAAAGAVSGLVIQWGGYPTLTLLAAATTLPLAALALSPARRPIVTVGTAALLAACLPAHGAAQSAVPVSRTEIDGLLTATIDVDSVAAEMGSQFATHVFQLVPDLTVEQRDIIAAAVAEAFDPAKVREDVAARLEAQASSWQQVAQMVAAHRTGALGELDRLEESFAPPQSLADFTAALRTTPLPRERAQLVVALLEARGVGDLALYIEEALERAARELVVALGASLPPFVPMSQADFDAVYRDRVRLQTIAFMHRYAPASDDLIRRATAELSSDAGRWYVEGLMAAIGAAATAGARRVAELTQVEPEPAAAPAPSLAPVDPSLPCRAVPCNLHTEWPGRPPAFNQTFGNAEDLEPRVFEHLLNLGFRIERGMRRDGITIVLRPRTIMALCGFMSGTDNRGCPAIGQVTIEFVGSTPGVDTPSGLTALNRCGDPTLIMGVTGVGGHVATAIAVALRTRPGERRETPRAPC